MSKDLSLELLACPLCNCELIVSDEEKTDTSFELIDQNGHKFSVVNGIPNLIPNSGENETQETSTLSSFNFQYGKEDWIYDYDCRRVDRVVSSVMSISAKDVEGKSVVIVGCGSGAEVEIFRRLGARSVVGFDLTSSIQSAAEHQKENKNTIIARGDASKPPLARESMDIVFCDGVLPHTAEPKKVLHEILGLLNDSGIAYVRTLITPENLRASAHLLPRKALRILTKNLPDGALWKLAYAFSMLDKIPLISWVSRRLFLYYDPAEQTLAVTQLTNFRMYGDHTYRHHLSRSEIKSVILGVWPKATIHNKGGYFRVSRAISPSDS